MALNQPFKQWNPVRYTLGFRHPSNTSNDYALVILNQPLENKELLVKLCAGAIYIACADGAANRLKDLCLEGLEERQCRPNAICGDMDSVRPEVEKHYRELGTQIVKDPDQYSTDLKKSLRHINERFADETRTHSYEIALIGGLGGRADQAFSVLHQMHSNYEDPLMNNDIYLVAPESIIFLLEKGPNKIHTPIDTRFLNKYVGIIPLGRPSIISTHGLEWDVQDWHTEFGTQVSTSNHVMNDVIGVQTTERVFFTIGTALSITG